MSATAHPPAPGGSIDPTQLTILYTDNPDGWVTAQIKEFPAAISQGADRHEAWVNVLDALHDLTHATQSPAQRVSGLVIERLRESLGALEDMGGKLRDGLRDVLRPRTHTHL